MAFKSYRALIGALVLPYDDEGTVSFTVPPLPAEWGMRYRLAAEGQDVPEIKTMTHGDELHVWLGSAYDEMIAADMEPAFIERALITAIAEFRSGRAEAERVWTLGEDSELGKAIRAAAELAANSPASPPLPSSAKASGRGSPAVTNGTTSRPATPRPARPRKETAKASAGRK